MPEACLARTCVDNYQPPAQPGRPRPRRFYAKVTLDPNRLTPQVSNIAQSIQSELDRTRGARWRIASIGEEDALILPHRANPCGCDFWERQVSGRDRSWTASI